MSKSSQFMCRFNFANDDFRNSVLEEGVVGKAPIMTICTHRNSGGVSAVSIVDFLPPDGMDHRTIIKNTSMVWTECSSSIGNDPRHETQQYVTVVQKRAPGCPGVIFLC
jgi:hypothetical protein